MRSKFIKKILVLSLAFVFVLNTSMIFAADKINIPKKIKIYYTAADAKYRTNSVGTWSAGDYYIFTKYDGMINITTTTSEPGAWINPNDINDKDIVIKDDVPTIGIETPIVKYSSYVVFSSMKAYGNVTDAYNSKNPVTTLSSGIYYLINASNNMIEISKTKSKSGYWINPARNTGQYISSHEFTNSGFINEIGPLAQKLASKNDLYASVMIAQAILESGWGNSLLAERPFYNLFGIKGSYRGDSILIKTFEYTSSGYRYNVLSNFRKYPSYLESLEDYVYLLTGDDDPNTWNYKFYLGARKSRTSNYKQATEFLTGRYATSPYYASSLNSIIETYNLTKFDTEEEKLGPVVSGYTTRTYNIRKGASTNSKVDGILKAGTYVKGNTVNNFIKLADGKYIYHGKLLKELKEVSGFLKADAKVAKHPYTSTIKTLNKDTFIKGKNLNNWIMLEDGTYVENKGLSDIPSTAPKVFGNLVLTMNIRKSPSTKATIVGYKVKGEYIEGHLYKGWIKLAEGKYIHESGLSHKESNEVDFETEGKYVFGYVVQDMNVRKSPSIKSSKVGNKSKGEYVEGYLNGDWIKLSDGNYMYKSGLSQEDLNGQSSIEGVKVSGNVVKDMNVRKSPDIKASVVGYRNKGDYIEGYLNGDWIKLSSGYYMHKSGLSQEDLNDESSFVGTKVSGNLVYTMNVRKSPSIKSTIIGYKTKGEFIEGYLNNGWIKLVDNTYIHESGLDMSKPSNSSNTNSSSNDDSSSTSDSTQGIKISGNIIQTMNIRKSPSIDADIVGYKYEGQSIEGYLDGDWIKLSDGNYMHKSAFSDKVLSEFINLENKKVSGNIVQTMNVRKLPSIDADIVGYRYEGQFIEGYLDGEWIKLSDENYVHKSALYR